MEGKYLKKIIDPYLDEKLRSTQVRSLYGEPNGAVRPARLKGRSEYEIIRFTAEEGTVCIYGVFETFKAEGK